MKIYDCFTFYNELDLLELRFEELYNHVDYFVLVEANKTFQNKSKPFYFGQNQYRYAKYMDKVIHIQVENMPEGDNAWNRERYQRNSIARGIVDAKPNDIIIVSDCDEIPRPEAIKHMKESKQMVFGLRMPLFNFKFNYMRTTPGEHDVWATAARRSVIDNISTDALRAARFSLTQCEGTEIIPHAGWHFSYLGDKNYLIDKAQSFSHTEVNRPDFFEQLDIEASINERKEWDRTQSNQYAIVEFDNYFPKSLIKNKDKYKNYILDNPETTVYNILQ